MIIVYGGAFNPPTKAHYNIIQTTYELFKPKAFIAIPVGELYHKDDLVSFSDRSNMLKLYQKDFPFLIVSHLEEKQKFNGTVETLEKISQEYRDEKIVLLIGSDQYLNFSNWIKYEEILKKYELIVILRPNYKIDETKYDEYNPRIRFIQLDLDISSTEVRNNVELNKDYLMNDVYEYIIKNKLYRR
ncbi:Probable nicotinate-nucleotide adenylyltransferase [Alteracholeplasma palmae J233]|uniref:Probable nicotinate-nucleotide adenylyltransferase n=1 Tax=Alteracholeplasma palmae (strain ATCC 49389 / J233) TaxID=1318466 RepID=U4KL19_ALTPJ|nr:nicotinate (nicotinamide) nucleotide adenylyltransferase [Alteracholeplasma palmae]CCV64559.1 Probable nicotinate-nucleotide adenylyltransferase [Alteracholeplasma palmae J233]